MTVIRYVKSKLLVLVLAAVLAQAGPCVPGELRPFSELTDSGGVLIGVLIVPQVDAQ